jgi:hypothetical protein
MIPALSLLRTQKCGMSSYAAGMRGAAVVFVAGTICCVACIQRNEARRPEPADRVGYHSHPERNHEDRPRSRAWTGYVLRGRTPSMTIASIATRILALARRWWSKFAPLPVAHRVRLSLKRPWTDGTFALDMDALALLSRLAASVPPPRQHVVRYAPCTRRRQSLAAPGHPKVRRRRSPRRGHTARPADRSARPDLPPTHHARPTPGPHAPAPAVATSSGPTSCA